VIVEQLDTVSRRLWLQPGQWIEQPDGFATVRLDGTLSEDGSGYASLRILILCKLCKRPLNLLRAVLFSRK